MAIDDFPEMRATAMSGYTSIHSDIGELLIVDKDRRQSRSPWDQITRRCEYCGRRNKYLASMCEGCGAPT